MTTNPTFAVAIQHSPWNPRRVDAFAGMWRDLKDGRFLHLIVDDPKPHGMDWHEFKTHLAIKQWQWAVDTGATHALFLTDDLHVAPRFWEILAAMVAAKPGAIMGLLSNHPRGPELAAAGASWYRCNSWVVGPAYLVPNHHLRPFLDWYRGLRDDDKPQGRRWFNDDSALNEWNTCHGGPGESWHPLPTIIEHRGDVDSTVGHGDRYSRERVSWRETRSVETLVSSGGFRWVSQPREVDLHPLTLAETWNCGGEMLTVGGEG